VRQKSLMEGLNLFTRKRVIRRTYPEAEGITRHSLLQIFASMGDQKLPAKYQWVCKAIQERLQFIEAVFDFPKERKVLPRERILRWFLKLRFGIERTGNFIQVDLKPNDLPSFPNNPCG
jgi:hypothetical protein